MSNYWCTEWKKLATDATEMCQETLEIVLDQLSHLCPGVDFSAINLKSRWDPKGRRIYVPEEASDNDSEVAEVPPQVGVVESKQQPEVTEQVQQAEPRDVAGDGGECPT
ncbi:hypothetical protein PIB30_016959 [Stylosanthes scabra]|uniref:Uncharacterized protein n=1 Tax=Stylosanthes scabra TaxID=79078 RepID=A0ABU6Y9G4_9FABA|nr:hypothetical protein [Stylosanthes scabra]